MFLCCVLKQCWNMQWNVNINETLGMRGVGSCLVARAGHLSLSRSSLWTEFVQAWRFMLRTQTGKWRPQERARPSLYLSVASYQGPPWSGSMLRMVLCFWWYFSCTKTDLRKWTMETSNAECVELAKKLQFNFEMVKRHDWSFWLHLITLPFLFSINHYLIS